MILDFQRDPYIWKPTPTFSREDNAFLVVFISGELPDEWRDNVHYLVDLVFRACNLEVEFIYPSYSFKRL